MKLSIFCCLLVVLISPLWGAKKALVIGNSNYGNAPLRNPSNDARLMTETLDMLGFQVTNRNDLDSVEFYRVIRDFSRSISIDDEVFFYYSGHAVQIDGENYLLPVREEIDDEITARRRSMPLNDLMDYLRNASLNIVVLDACRDNPFTSFRSASRGLAQVSPRTTNYYIVYSTQPGAVAEDGLGENSLFTQAFSNYLKKPGLSFDEVINNVSRNMNELTRGKQRPHRSTTIDRNVYLNPVEQPKTSLPVTTMSMAEQRPPTTTIEQITTTDQTISGRVYQPGISIDDKKGRFSLGVRAGINVSEIIYDSEDDSDSFTIESKAGYNLGIFTNFPIYNNLLLQLELLQNEKGYILSSEDPPYFYEEVVSINYFEIPVVAKYDSQLGRLRLQPYFGFSYGFLTHAKVSWELTDYSYGVTEKDKEDVHEFFYDSEFSLNFGLDIFISKRFLVGFRHNMGTSNIFKNAETDVNNSVWAIYTEYLIIK